jgi:pyrroloquinoline quinone (PQQ) biosynthesis protein C
VFRAIKEFTLAYGSTKEGHQTNETKKELLERVNTAEAHGLKQQILANTRSLPEAKTLVVTHSKIVENLLVKDTAANKLKKSKDRVKALNSEIFPYKFSYYDEND